MTRTLIFLAVLFAAGRAVCGEPLVWKAVKRPPPPMTNAVEERLERIAVLAKGGTIRASGQLGGRLDDAGLTALGALAFLGAGYSSTQGQYAGTVQAMIAGLGKLQKEDGRLTDDLLSHALACVALAENCGMTGKGERELVQKSLDFLAGQQLDGGGFPAKAGGRDPDDLATFFATLAFKSAKIAGLKVEGKTFQFIMNWLTGRIDAKSGVALGPDGRPDRLATAGVAVGLQMLGTPRDDGKLVKLGAALLEQLPSSERPDFVYWYLGQLACFQMGGEHWKQWHAAAKEAVIDYVYVRTDVQAEPLTAEARKRVPELVEAMRSEEFAKREAASREAGTLPAAAVGLFEPHLKDRDPEVVWRVEEVVGEMRLRQACDPFALIMTALPLEIYYRYLPVLSR